MFRQFIRTLIQLFHCSKAWSLLCVQVTRQLLYVSAVSWYPLAQTWVLGAAGPTWTPCIMPLTLTSRNWSESCWKLLNPEVHTHNQWHTRQNVNKDYHLLAFKAHLKTRFYCVTFIIFVLNKWPFPPPFLCLYSVELHLQWFQLRYSSPHCRLQSVSRCSQMSARARSQPHCPGKNCSLQLFIYLMSHLYSCSSFHQQISHAASRTWVLGCTLSEWGFSCWRISAA